MNRRLFTKQIFKGLAGTTLLVGLSKESLFAKADLLTSQLLEVSDSEEYWEIIKHHFSLRQDLYYFNNASLGPSPEIVIDATEKYRRTLDAFPSRYMWGDWNDEKEQVRKKAAKIMGANAEEIALIHNTTEAMNIVAASLDLKAGDEVIIADHEHPSGVIPWKYWKETKGIKLIRIKLPIIPKSKDEIIKLYKKAIGPRTKVILMSHMINTTGMILPVKEVCAIARPKGILTVVDGAQSAGMLNFNLHELGCDYYAASSHKWLFSPKGMGIFYARKESQKYIKPLIVANGYEDESIRRFENYNTRNLPELLGLGTALDFHNLIGSEKIHDRIFELKRYFREKLSHITYINWNTPESDKLSAGIQNIEIIGTDVNDVRDKLLDIYKIDCRPMTKFDLNGLRISLSIFITKKDIDFLINAIEEIQLG